MSRSARSVSGQNLDELSHREGEVQDFDCLLQIPAPQLTVVTLHDARWSHRGRWHLTGNVVGLPEHVVLLSLGGMVEVIYHDKSSEVVHWIIKDRVYQVSVSHGRLSAYTDTAPRYPKGRSLVRSLDLDPLANQDLRGMVLALLGRLLPDLDLQRKHWLADALIDWRNTEVRDATNKIARQFADERDLFEAKIQEIRQCVGDWLDGGAHDDAFRAIGRQVEVYVP